MCFDKPKPFIYATRNLSEQVRRISIIQLIRFTDRVASLLSKRGEGAGDRLDMGQTVGDGERVFGEP